MLLLGEQQLTMFTVTTVCRRCLMPKLMTIILSAASALSDAALAKDALFMMKRRCSRNNHRVAVAIPSLPLLPQTPQQHYSWAVLQRGRKEEEEEEQAETTMSGSIFYVLTLSKSGNNNSSNKNNNRSNNGSSNNSNNRGNNNRSSGSSNSSYISI